MHLSTPLAADGGATGTVTAAAVTPGQRPTGADTAPATQTATEATPDDFTAPVPVAGADTETDDQAAAREQREEDLAWRTEHPNEPLTRAANPAVGGEAF